MKKLLIWVMMAALAFAMGGCQSAMTRLEADGYSFEKGSVTNDTGSTEIFVYNWGEYMRTDLNKAFEEVTGIRVRYSTFDTNENLYSQLRSGTGDYDVIIPSDYMINLLIEEGMIQPLDFGNIPNFADVDPSLKNPDYDPQNLYSVPYTWGTVGIIYNSTMVEGAVDSWDILFDEKLSGNILMFGNSRDAMAIALRKLGHSLNTTSEAELEEALALLEAQKPLVQAYVMDQIFDKLENGEAAVGPYYAGDALTMMESNPDLRFVHPKEGTNLFVDAFCIPLGAQNKAAAEMYINFMCSYQAGMANIEEIGYSTPLMTVYENLDEDIRENGISYVNPSDPQFEVFINLPKETRELYAHMWTRLFA